MSFQLRNTYTSLPPRFFSPISPTPVTHPSWVVFNHSLAEQLGINNIDLKLALSYLSGNALPPQSQPIAQAYSGHQFGHFVRLGDGRAILLGEITDSEGRLWDLQLKGAGRTPYSRRGDGRAALGPMLREYLVSEAMHFLGIPTTRSLAVVLTGETVQRLEEHPGALLARVAQSHIRVGTFEFAATQEDPSLLSQLTQYTINRHYSGANTLEFLKATIDRQARLIAQWMQVGFIHGVMNTDNMAISGETIDYGPCAFMDSYHPETVFSSIDQMGRYAYGNQPQIGLWNLERLAASLLPLLDQNVAMEALYTYRPLLQRYYLEGMAKKLGIQNFNPSQDESLIQSLLAWMEKEQADYTLTFRRLALGTLAQAVNPPIEWLNLWSQRLEQEGQSVTQAQTHMLKVNPAVIPRNHWVEQALDRAEKQNDLKLFFEILEAVQNPFDNRWDSSPLAAAPLPHERVEATFCGT